MTLDIFSSQDSFIFYFSSILRSIVWIHIILIILFFVFIYWVSIRRLNIFFCILLNSVNKIFSDNIGKEENSIRWGIYFIFFFIFFLIFLLNYRGLVSYIFSYRLHMVVVVPIGFTIWLRIILYLNLKRFKNFFTHLIPYGIPLWLAPFILIIETVRRLVRPITLSVRLMANIGAGHIIIHLIRIGCVSSRSLLGFLSISTIIAFYIIFEILISIVQSLIFFTLLTLYIRE